MTKPVSTQLRIRDREVWEAFKELASSRHMSANSLLNLLIEAEVDKAKSLPAFL